MTMKKIMLFLAGTVATLAGVFALGSTSAATDQTGLFSRIRDRDRNWNRVSSNMNWRWRDNNWDWNRNRNNWRDWYRMNRFRFNNNVVLGSRYFQRNVNVITDFGSRRIALARQIVIVDRDNPDSVILIDNRRGGPFRYNQLVIRVDSDTFQDILDRIRINQNLDISGITGSNVIYGNSIIGDIDTGDISVSTY